MISSLSMIGWRTSLGDLLLSLGTTWCRCCSCSYCNWIRKHYHYHFVVIQRCHCRIVSINVKWQTYVKYAVDVVNMAHGVHVSSSTTWSLTLYGVCSMNMMHHIQSDYSYEIAQRKLLRQSSTNLAFFFLKSHHWRMSGSNTTTPSNTWKGIIVPPYVWRVHTLCASVHVSKCLSQSFFLNNSPLKLRMILQHMVSGHIIEVYLFTISVTPKRRCTLCLKVCQYCNYAWYLRISAIFHLITTIAQYALRIGHFGCRKVPCGWKVVNRFARNLEPW